MRTHDLASWESILKFTLSQSGGGGENGGTATSMSEEEKEWLKKALTEMMAAVEDDVSAMKRCLAFVSLSEDSLIDAGGGGDAGDMFEKKCEHLEELADLVENIDTARDLYKIGGVSVLFMSICSIAVYRWPFSFHDSRWMPVFARLQLITVANSLED